ncbi:hypothetical protein FACS1894208_10200 [Clostridia bacterium]|nr:hypothetical protein FACS1894208_10200 [Clostridia bacterium]
MITKPEIAWLSDPQIFEVNRLAAHSDHVFLRGRGYAAETILERRLAVSL